jgi:hypothetical protein
VLTPRPSTRSSTAVEVGRERLQLGGQAAQADPLAAPARLSLRPLGGELPGAGGRPAVPADDPGE